MPYSQYWHILGSIEKWQRVKEPTCQISSCTTTVLVVFIGRQGSDVNIMGSFNMLLCLLELVAADCVLECCDLPVTLGKTTSTIDKIEKTAEKCCSIVVVVKYTKYLGEGDAQSWDMLPVLKPAATSFTFDTMLHVLRKLRAYNQSHTSFEIG